MIAALTRTWDNLLGRGEAAVTVPPLDGALRPNRRLDEAEVRLPLTSVDCLATISGRLTASAGFRLHTLAEDRSLLPFADYEEEVACIAPLDGDGYAVALANGDIVLEGSQFNGRRLRIAPEIRCITAMAADGSALFVANGSASHGPADWQLDLLHCKASGSVWRIDLESGRSTRIAGGLAFPAGIVVDGPGVVCAEAWKHRLIRIGDETGGSPTVLYADLPGYPGRLTPAAEGFWLAVFAPRSQLVEFVLREPAYRKRMIAEVQRPYWVAPKLRAGRSFYEPLQGGGVKHLGLLKPWAPTLSAGLCVKLDDAFQPRRSLHSRADGITHGITSVVEHDGQLFAAACGDGVVVGLDLATWGDEG